jgi:hypothetical protein
MQGLSMAAGQAKRRRNLSCATFREYIAMASGNDIKAAESTYTGFISIVKYSSIIVALAVAVVIFLIS